MSSRAIASLVVGSVAATICAASAASASAGAYSTWGLIGFWLAPALGILAIILSLSILIDRRSTRGANLGAIAGAVLGSAPIGLFVWVAVLAFFPAST